MTNFKIKVSGIIRNNSLLIFLSLIYSILGVYSLDFCFFWDCIELVSKQAHWYYLYDMNPLSMPVYNDEFPMLSTIPHIPLVPYMTAVLWKIFGRHLWVSHLFSLFWAFILIYNVHKLAETLFKKKQIRNWFSIIILLESTLLSQFVIGSPDFILITGFIISIRGILQRKKVLLAIGLIFLCCVSVRGIFVGFILFIGNLLIEYRLSKNPNIKILTRTAIPYIPVFFIILIYFLYYIFAKGWFFWETGHSSVTYTASKDVAYILKHLFELTVRMLENGRFFLFGLAFILIIRSLRGARTPVLSMFILCLTLLLTLYLYFALFTKMPFLGRYFMPHYILATVIVFLFIEMCMKKTINWIVGIIIFFQVSGNFWIYPEKIIKVWDGTLAHIPFYELRKECFTYIDIKGIDYNDISGGFCIFDNRKYIELNDIDKFVNNNRDSKYFIYSNISPHDDAFIEELKDWDKWRPIETFRKGFVYIIIYEQI